MGRALLLLPLLLLLTGCGQVGMICDSPSTRCGRICTNLAVDPGHCGSCGTTCPSGFECQQGSCACPSGSTACGQRCVGLQTDPANCGACGQACPAQQSCVQGACTP